MIPLELHPLCSPFGMDFLGSTSLLLLYLARTCICSTMKASGKMNRGGKDRVNTMHFHLQLFQSLLFTAGMHPQLATSIADEKMVESIPSSIVLRPETLF